MKDRIPEPRLEPPDPFPEALCIECGAYYTIEEAYDALWRCLTCDGQIIEN